MPQLVAYITPAGAAATNGHFSVDELLAFLGDRLPAHMLPNFVVAVDHLPLTPNGKLDRAALRQRALSRPVGKLAASGDVTPTEAALTGIGKSLLGVAVVDRDDNLFHLGGHSLTAVRLSNRVAQVLGIELPPLQVFRAPRLADLARYIDKAAAVRGRVSNAERAPHALTRGRTSRRLHVASGSPRTGAGDGGRAIGGVRNVVCSAKAVVPGEAERSRCL